MVALAVVLVSLAWAGYTVVLLRMTAVMKAAQRAAAQDRRALIAARTDLVRARAAGRAAAQADATTQILPAFARGGPVLGVRDLVRETPRGQR